MAGVLAFLGNNAAKVDAQEKEDKLRSKVPELLQLDEHVVYAFKGRGGKGRDSQAFTTKRIILKKRTGMAGKKAEYTTVPYKNITAWAFETCGTFEAKQDVTLYALGVEKISLDYVESCNLFELNKFLSEKILVEHGQAGHAAAQEAPVSDSAAETDGATGVLDFLGGNLSQINPAEVEKKLKASKTGVLLPDEKVEMAFKCGRDSFLLTDKRILRIDVQGLTGKSVEYYTLTWPAVRAFGVETAGGLLNRDATLTLYTRVPDTPSSYAGMPRRARTRFEIDFKKGGADLFGVQRYIADKILGLEVVASQTGEATASIEAIQAEGKAATNLIGWLGDDSKMIDIAEAQKKYSQDPPILQQMEKVEWAFKGRRDVMLFTGKRMIFVDLKGLRGKKAEYVSIPWQSVAMYGIQTAGTWLDNNCNMMIWTDFDDSFFPQAEENEPKGPPFPRNSYIECDFQKDKIDLFALHRYLTLRCLWVDDESKSVEVPLPPTSVAPAPPDAVTNLLGWLGDKAHAIDANDLNARLHGEGGGVQLLENDERVCLAFKAARSTFVLTSKRVFLVDKSGLISKKVSYISIPYPSIRAFHCSAANGFRGDCDVTLFTSAYWRPDGSMGNELKQDLRKGQVDVIAVQQFFGGKILGIGEGEDKAKYNSPPPTVEIEATGFDNFMSYLTDAGVSLDKATVSKQLKDIKLTQADENVESAYKVGRDMCVFTNKRVFVLDKKGGFIGKSVEYKSIPLRYVCGFKVSTAGLMLSHAGCSIYCDGSSTFEQDLSKASTGIWEIEKILHDSVVRAGTGQAVLAKEAGGDIEEATTEAAPPNEE